MNKLFVAIAGIVFLWSFVLTAYLCSPYARFLLLDHPNERSLHSRLTPRTGGLAIILSLATGVTILVGMAWICGSRCGDEAALLRGVPLSLLIGEVLVVIVSFLDDVRGLPVAIRFGAHAVAAILIVWQGGFIISELLFPGIGALRLGWLAVPLSVLFIMWMTNLYNFMDGMDGFAGGMTTIGFSFMGYLGWTEGHHFIAVLSVLIAAAASGFLFFNLPPARVFMGDTGSTALGFLAGALAVLGVYDGLFDIWVPILVFSPFIVDATATLLRRMTRRQLIWQPHREHYYQRVVLAGWGHRKTVVAEYALMIVAGFSAVLYRRAGVPGKLTILGFWTCFYLLIALAIGRFVERRKLPDSLGPSTSSDSVQVG